MAETYTSVMRHGNVVTAKNELLQVNYNLATGVWNYMDATGYTIIRDAYAKVKLRNGTTITTKDDGHRSFKTSSVSDDIGACRQIKFSHKIDQNRPSVDIYLKFYDKQPFVILSLGLENQTKNDIQIEQLNLIDVSPIDNKPQGGIYLGVDPSTFHLFLNTPATTAVGTRDVYDGYDATAMTSNESQHDGLLYDTESKRALIFGFLTFQKWFSHISTGYDSKLQADKNQKGINKWSLYHKGENNTCRAGEEILSESIYLNFSSSVSEARKIYTQLIAQLMGAVTLDAVFSGWVCWQGDSAEISEEHVMRQLDWITRHPEFYPTAAKSMEYIQIGLGWEKQLGRNEADGKRFPNGMKWLAEQIHQKGLKAGICIAPFCGDEGLHIIKEHPEYMLHDSEGNLVLVEQEDNSRIAFFDPSHQGTQEYIRNRITPIIDDWGYDLIKVDLLSYRSSMATGEVVYHDNSLTSVQAYRLAINLLAEHTEASERDAILLPYCSYDGANIGIFKSSCVSAAHPCKIATQLWEDDVGSKELTRGWASRLHLHDTIWTNDFGPILLKDSLPLNEALVVVTAAALSGGIVFAGDDLINLSAERADILAKMFPLYGKAASPIDLYDNNYPQIWNLKISSPFDNWNIVGIFNWADLDADVSFKLTDIGLDSEKYFLAHEFWSKEYLGEFKGSIILPDLPPRSVKLLCLREERDVPQLLSTDMHFTQGGVEILSAGWDARSNSFLVVCQNPKQSDGTIFIYVPEDYVPASVAGYGAEYNFNWRRPVYQIKLAPTDKLVHLSVHLGKTSG